MQNHKIDFEICATISARLLVLLPKIILQYESECKLQQKGQAAGISNDSIAILL